MSLDQLHLQLAWPPPSEILQPTGAGPKLIADLARRKIEKSIAMQLSDDAAVKVGLLLKNPRANSTEAPIAVVCEFTRGVAPSTLGLAHRLAWNFARSPLLITVEPHQVKAWSCCEPPSQQVGLFDAEISEAHLNLNQARSPSEQAAHTLHWVRLVSGEFFQQFPERFRRDGRADRALLEELTTVRKRLKQQRLEPDTIHDLLARVVFMQFLFDRQDADGHGALNPSLLARLSAEGVLKDNHSDLQSILGDYDDAYRFFRWLNAKFNGDLFPGKGSTEKEREAEWQEEMTKVEPRHLQTLADFVSGKVKGEQRVFWRQYAFDVIPLEFISSIYEEFVTAPGAHYTPGFLVDFMLDEVLSWEGDDWNLKILDPSCGSGIFLVKAYQRLIQRWKNKHPEKKPDAGILKQLLERNLFGVDIDPHAIRVASFSLYLTMCDELDPKTYLKSIHFPRLRDVRLLAVDFFREDVDGTSTAKNGPSYDIVIGNAPWGKSTETKTARTWASGRKPTWEIPNRAVGTLFLIKALSLTRGNGQVSMIQPASSLLFNRSGTANRFRERLFTSFKVDEIVNLSTLRFELFEGAASPPCIVTLRPTEPDENPILYISPKQVRPARSTEVAESTYTIVIEPNDISRIWPDEAVSERFVWTALAWGGRRDLALIKQLSRMPTLKRMCKPGKGVCRNGIQRGDLIHDDILGWRILESETFPENCFLSLNATNLPTNKNPGTHRLTDLAAFALPQIVIKRSWTRAIGRFQAAVVRNTNQENGVICVQNFVSVHLLPQSAEMLESAAIIYNSRFAAYFLLLTSGRMASYRPNATVGELLAVPIPAPAAKIKLSAIKTQEALEAETRSAFGFRDAECTLIDDMIQYVLPDFHGDDSLPGRRPTRRSPIEAGSKEEPDLQGYCRTFLGVLSAGFGQERAISATIFCDGVGARLPVRMVAIHLDWAQRDKVVVETIDSGELCQRLVELDQKFLSTSKAELGGIFFQRVARVYDEYHHRGRAIPTIYIVKPDRIRYWLRSIAMRDADEVAADIQLWWDSLPKKAATKREKK